jgi:hypothetical protein
MVALLLRVAREHGFNASPNASGGVDVQVPWTAADGSSGVDVFSAATLRQLLVVLNYWA